MASPILVEMQRRLRQMPADEKEEMRRAITGEADSDLISKGEVYHIIAEVIMETLPLPETREIQKALGTVRRKVSKYRRAKEPLTARFGCEK